MGAAKYLCLVGVWLFGASHGWGASDHAKPAASPLVAKTKATEIQPVGDPLPKVLSLKQAEDYALAHHPAIKEAKLNADAAKQGAIEARSGLFPQLTGEAVFAKSTDDDARMAVATGLSNPTILTRESQGLYLSQLITDFGKTALLASSSIFKARSDRERISAVRQLVLLNVDRAYFGALGAEALVRLTDQEVATNQLLFDRIKALAASNLKSNLDVSLQAANLAQTRLLQVNAQGRRQEALADLVEAVGSEQEPDFKLADEESSLAQPSSLPDFVAQAVTQRPDLIALRLDRDAALKYASAQGAARLPVVSAIAAGGLTPYRESNGNLTENYGMVGVNVSVPLFTGGKLSAQQKEAQLRAQALEQALEGQEMQIIRDVRAAWINVQTSYKGIGVSKDFLDASSSAFTLAQNLYVAGTSSIVEVSQADLQRLQAEIAYIQAKYQYRTRLSVLAYQAGALR